MCVRACVCVDTNIGFKYVKNLKKNLSYFFIYQYHINNIHTIELKNKTKNISTTYFT